MASENYITHKILNEFQKELDREIKGHIDKLDDKIGTVDNKVGQLNDLVLPMVISMKQTAENTKEMADSLKDFTNSQRQTNDLFKDKMHEHDLSIEGFKGITKLISDKKKYNATVIVALIGLVGIFITSLFQLAPIIFN